MFKAGARPALDASITSDPYLRANASAIGLRQMLPMHKNSTRFLDRFVFAKEEFMDTRVLRQLRVKRGCEMPSLLYQHRVTVIAGEHSRALANTPDDRRANEDRLQIATCDSFRLQIHDPAVELPPIGITFDSDVHDAERVLNGIRDFRRDQNRTRAGTKYGLASGELAQRLCQSRLIQQLEHRRTLAARYDQALHPREFF